MCLLYLSLINNECDLMIPKIKEPKDYATRIKNFDDYYGYGISHNYIDILDGLLSI